MSRRRYDLPSLTTLAVFETAGRHLSFKDAAQELSVTPGAVSHQIKALEKELGVALFQRKHRGVVLTRDGQDLLDTLAMSFHQISRQLSKIRQDDGQAAISVGSTTSVAALWLSPAIIRFWKDFPDLNINQITQDRPFSGSGDLDFYIRYGRDETAALSHTPLFRDQLTPVATPDVAKGLDSTDLEHLASQRLIHLDSPNRTWTTWADWFAAFGYHGKIAVGARVTSYSVALQLARKGAGVALGWRRLIRPLLMSEKLVELPPHTMRAPKKFYLVGLPDTALSDNARKLKNWIIDEVRAGTV